MEAIAQQKKERLIMPEYGRNIQKMVQYACSIDDRAERTRCARTIIDIMGNMFPYLRDIDDFKHKLWDHLYIMSDGKLDIDYPFEVRKPENRPAPERIPYQATRIKYRHYGRWIETLVAAIAKLPDDEKRAALTRLVANDMKQSYVTWNKELADDNKIFDDLRELSGGAIDIKNDAMTLNSAKRSSVGNSVDSKKKNNKKNQKNNQRRSK